MNNDARATLFQAMGTCLVFIISFIAYGVSLRRAERRRKREVQEVMWKKPVRPSISPVKEYNYANLPHDVSKVSGTTPSPNRAQRRLDKQINPSHTVNWAD